MAIGRISGPLLKSNLIRNGIDLAFETDLLYLDVTNNRIGINTATPEHDLDVNGTIRTTNLVLDKLTAGNITIENNDITSSTGTIDLGTADQVVYQNKLIVDSFEINDNTIRTTDSNANVEIATNGTGSIELLANTNVTGNLHATGNISADGNIILGDADTDSIDFNAEIASDIIPNASGTYNLGTSTKAWNSVHADTVNGQTINTTNANISGISLNTRHANTLYVSENGSNNNAGNHPQSPYLTVEKALQNATAGDTIHVYPGVYQERLPLVIPAGVTVKGHSMRSVTIKPDSVDSEDVFHLNGETTVEDLTIQDFYYNSGTDVGYAFKFAPNFKVTSRSPYVRNVTVITKGSVTNASDPRGFNQGDAGKGAFLDGSVAHADSKEASLLFHAATFITPGVDALTVKNGVRVEWLNSFTYFANRGFYATNGSTGLKGSGETEFRVSDVTGSFSAGETFAVNSIDGSTVIASGVIDRKDADDKFYIAGNVQGITEATTRTSKAIAFKGSAKLNTAIKKFGTSSLNLDGVNSYLSIGAHDNFGFGTDDFTLEAWIYASSTTGEQPIFDMRAGIATDTAPYFYLDGTTLKYKYGNTQVINGGTISANTWHHVAVSRFANGTRMYFDGNQIGSTYVDNNNYGTTKPLFIGANFNLANFFTGHIDDIRISNSARYLDTTYTVPTSQIVGDNNCVFLTHLDGALNDTSINEDIKVKQNLTFSGGATANFIDLYNTTDFGAEIRSIGSANVYGNKGAVGDGTGVIMYLIGHNFAYIGNGKEVTNDETTVVQANEVEELNNAKVRFTSVDHKGDFRVGDNFYVNQETGEVVFDAVNLNITTPDGITFGTGGNVTFIDGTKIETGDFRLSGNTIETLTQNFVIDSATNTVDIEADTNITGNLAVTGNFTLGGNITIGDADTDSVEFASDVNSDILPNTDNTFDLGTTTKRWKNIYANNFDNGNLKIEGNTISAQDSNSDLELVASGTGSVVVPNNNVEITGTLTTNDTATFNNTVTVNNNLNVLGAINQTGASTTINANLTVRDGLIVDNSVQFENIFISGNKIQTTDSDSDLELTAAGTGRVVFPDADLEVGGNIVVAGTAQFANLAASGTITADTITVNTATFNGQLNLEDIEINDNYITTTESDSNLELRAAGTGKIVFPDNDVDITGDLNVTGTVQFNSLSGNVYTTNSLTVNRELNINGQVQFEDIEINDNYITTTLSDSDLELRANGTGSIVFLNDTVAKTNLTVDGTTTFVGNVTGTTATFDDVTINNNMTVQGQINFDNIQINDNTITTTESNSDLELEASGTGTVIVPSNNVVVEKDLTVQGVLNADNLDALGRVTANSFSTGDILIDDNFITTTQSNSDLELRANGTGKVTLDDIKFNNNIISSTADMVLNPGSGVLKIDSIDSVLLPKGASADRNSTPVTGMLRYNTDTNSFEGYNGQWVSLHDGLQDGDGDTKITVELTPGANDNVIRFYNAGALTADLTSQRFSTNKLIVDDIEIDSNEIKTITTNADLVLSGNGTGGVILDQMKFDTDSVTNTVSDSITTFNVTGTGYYKFAGTGGVVIPTGNNIQRPAPINAEEGMMRYNNEDDRVEIFDGTNWVSVAGSSGGISRNDAEGIALEFVLVLG
jgi:cytoskeletal protein CcmA (bactofilin family)